jgi:hypothetical protein
MGRFLVLLILVSILVPLGASAGVWSDSEWSLITDLKLESLFWPSAYGQGTNRNLQQLQLVPTVSGKSGESWRAYFKPEFFWDPQNNSPEERVFLNVGEAYLKRQDPTFSVRAGSNIVNWGVTDGYNPLDRVNPRQYFDPLNSKKLGVWSLLFSHSSESAEQDLILIPRRQRSILPGTNSRWLPREIFIPQSQDNNVVLLLPNNIHFAYGEAVTLNEALDNNAAARLQWHLANIDVGLYGFSGASNFPAIQAEVTGTVLQVSPQTIIQTDPDVTLRVKNYRENQVGFSWISSQGNFLFKYAASYSQSQGDDPVLPGWSHQQVAALERNFNFGHDVMLVAVLQYSTIQSQKEKDSNLSVDDIFRRAWILGGRFSWNDVWTANAVALYDSVHFSQFQQVSIARRFFDTWTAELAALTISGDSATPLGIYSHNDNFRCSLSRSF